MDNATSCVDVQVYVYVALQRSHAVPQRGLGGLLDGPRPWRVLRQQRLELRVQVLRLHAAAERLRIVKLRAARAIVVRRPLPDLFRYTTRIDSIFSAAHPKGFSLCLQGCRCCGRARLIVGTRCVGWVNRSTTCAEAFRKASAGAPTFQVFLSVCRRERPSSRTSLSVGSTGSGNSSSPAASASAISAAVGPKANLSVQTSRPADEAKCRLKEQQQQLLACRLRLHNIRRCKCESAQQFGSLISLRRTLVSSCTM